MKKPMWIGVNALVALFLAETAGAVETFIPLARNRNTAGATYQTVIWLTNTATSNQNASVFFVATGANGATSGTPTTVALAAGQSLRFEAGAPQGSSGMMRIDAPAAVKVDARIEATTQGGLVSAAHITPLSAATANPAGKQLDVLGLVRTQGGLVSDYGMANLSREEASCSITAHRANGTEIAPTATLTVPPLSTREFSEVFSTLSAPEIADARIELTCNKAFTAYGLVFEPGGPRTAYVPPGVLLDGDLEPGGGLPGEVIFNVPGEFLFARNGDSQRVYNMPLVPNQLYAKATVEFDMFLSRFPPGLFTGVAAMRRTHRDRHERRLYYGIQIRNDNKKTNLDLGEEVLARGQGNWKQNRNYHMMLEVDIANGRRVTLTVFEGGQVVHRVSGVSPYRDLIDDGNRVSVDFGQTGIADFAYFPPIGWRYSNLMVKFEPLGN